MSPPLPRPFVSSVVPVALAALTAFAVVTAVCRVGKAAAPAVQSARCRVTLAALSYDTPGADDAEFIELQVERFGGEPNTELETGAPAHGGVPDAGFRAAADAAVPADAARDGASGVLTLGDCGLSEIRLVNGGGAACDTYRTLPLSAIAVPADGYVVLCATDSTLAPRGLCDVTSAGASALKNGFLQNGPSDGLELVGANGEVLAELDYEGTPACFNGKAVPLAAETGEITGEGGQSEDDVDVDCDGAFSLRAASAAPLRAPVPCMTESAPEGGPLQTDGGAHAPDAHVPWVPEIAPGAPSLPDAGFYGPFSFDAGYEPPTRTAPRPPPAPGCTVGAPDSSVPCSPGRWAALLGVFATGNFRRRARTRRLERPARVG
jgi:hypothetical protein